MKNVVIGLFIFLSGALFGQDKGIDPKYIYCYKGTVFETEDYKIYIEDAVNEDDFSKFLFSVYNKTYDYLVFKPEDIIFRIGGQILISKDRPLVVLPNSGGSTVLDVKGRGLQKENYEIEIKTVHKIAATVPFIKIEAIKIPSSKPDLAAGGFKCSIKKEDLAAKKAIVKFECVYNGDAIGIISPRGCKGIMASGKQKPNYDIQNDIVLTKGKPVDFVFELKEKDSDLTKTYFEIQFTETFRESKTELIAGCKIPMELDKTKTEAKNK